MNKTSSVLIFALIFSTSTAPMKRAGAELLIKKVKKHKTPATVSEKTIPALPMDVLGKIILMPFETWNESFTKVQNAIYSLILINKDIHNYISRPDIIRYIVNNITRAQDPFFKGILANAVPIKAIQNYRTASEQLNFNARPATDQHIKELINNGADINYCCGTPGTRACPPVLFSTLNNPDRTELLLSLGADPTIKQWCSSPFDRAITVHNTSLLALYSQYSSCKGYLNSGIYTKNSNVVRILLNSKTISQDELNNGLKLAKKLDLKDIQPLLIEAGAVDDKPAKK